MMLTFGAIASSLSSFAPPDLSGLQIWLKADALTLSDGDLVATWTDSSGHGRDFVASDSAHSPIFKTGIMNGKPVVRIGTDKWLTGGDLSAAFPTGATLFCVYTTTTGQYSVYKDETDDTFWSYDGVGYFGTFRSSRINGYPATTPTSGTHLVAVMSDASAYKVAIDGVASSAQAAAYLAGANHYVGDLSTVHFTGDVAECILYNSALSDSDRAKVEGYLSAKYALGF